MISKVTMEINLNHVEPNIVFLKVKKDQKKSENVLTLLLTFKKKQQKPVKIKFNL